MPISSFINLSVEFSTLTNQSVLSFLPGAFSFPPPLWVWLFFRPLNSYQPGNPLCCSLLDLSFWNQILPFSSLVYYLILVEHIFQQLSKKECKEYFETLYCLRKLNASVLKIIFPQVFEGTVSLSSLLVFSVAIAFLYYSDSSYISFFLSSSRSFPSIPTAPPPPRPRVLKLYSDIHCCRSFFIHYTRYSVVFSIQHVLQVWSIFFYFLYFFLTIFSSFLLE